jgi:hypothetical protein
MIKHFILSFTMMLLVTVSLFFFQVNAQKISAPLSLTDIQLTIENDSQTSDREYEFDLYLKDTDTVQPFELSSLQIGILVNDSILNGGTLTAILLVGTSELVPVQQPTYILWAPGSPNGFLKLNPRPNPGCGSGTIISAGTPNPLGTRVTRIRIINSVPWAQARPNLTFSFTSPAPTNIFQNSGTPCTSNQVLTDPTNCHGGTTWVNPILNGLLVTPSNQPVPATSGITSFAVVSIFAWTTSSNQSWCTVTSSGSGNGTISATYSENTDPSPRVANITVTASTLPPVVVTVTQQGSPFKHVNLTVFLQGLYIGNSSMRAAMDESGYRWGISVADKLTIELHNGSDYSNIIYTDPNVMLNINGTASIDVPLTYNGNFYLTVKQRNHILITSANPVSFSTSVIAYNFDASSKAFGNNMYQMSDGKWVVYSGDSNQDGIVDGSDLSAIGNLADFATMGYLPTDLNGDGLVDGSDLSIAGNNASFAIGAVTP